jgi:hypothetical protein
VEGGFVINLNEVIEKNFSKYFSVKGICQRCGRYSYLNKNRYCVSCWLEVKEKAGKSICFLCGKITHKKISIDMHMVKICDECRKSLFKKVINDPKIQELKKNFPKDIWIKDENIIRNKIIEFLKDGEKSKYSLRQYFFKEGISSTFAFQILNKMIAEGIIKNKTIQKNIAGRAKKRIKYSLVNP